MKSVQNLSISSTLPIEHCTKNEQVLAYTYGNTCSFKLASILHQIGN
ncbi:hypothetical protein LS684_11320 [Cytobacillus spongiae]|nr:hypothetical protein [Cytobacillus spongiae]UII54281.1 hypothetical protein LS684_11320 [Cytobacillus spongiae]